MVVPPANQQDLDRFSIPRACHQPIHAIALQGHAALPQAGERRLGYDGLKESGNELAHQPPEAGPRQAACAERGESSSASTSGSSSKIIKR